MAQKKASEVDSWLARSDPRVSVVLIYGPDRGLVGERARKFAAGTGLSLEDPFSVVRFDASEVEREGGRLLDEALTVPMFSSRRLLWVRNATAHKGFADEIAALLMEPASDATILIEAGELKKGAGLRANVEAAATGMALPCYADEGRDLDALIDEELKNASMTMTLEARQALRKDLGGDRLASRGEIAKLLLYTHGSVEITLDDVKAMSGDVSGQSFDSAVDAALEGRVSDFDTIFTRQSQAGGRPFQALSAATRQLQAIQAMRFAMETSGRNAVAVVAGHRPPVFFSRRTLIENAVQRWKSDALARALTRLHTALLQSRRHPDLAIALARQALLGVAVESARLANTAPVRRFAG